MPVDLVKIPNTADIITNGDQYVARALLPGLLAAAAAFRAETARPVYVEEGFRSDEEQRRVFLERYYRTPKKTGVFYDGSYWIKRTGFATAAIPGSVAAKHRLGRALDLWSGIDSSFTSREHKIWVRVAEPHGWVNTGKNFGEPWHQEGTPGVSPAGSEYVPIPGTTTPSEEDDMFSDLDRAKLDLLINTLSSEDSGTGKGGIRGTVNQILAAENRPDPQAVHKLVRIKSKPDVFHSVDFHTLRGIPSEKVLDVLGWQLQQIGALDTRAIAVQVLTVDGIEDLKGFGALIGPRPLGSDGKPNPFYASL